MDIGEKLVFNDDGPSVGTTDTAHLSEVFIKGGTGVDPDDKDAFIQDSDATDGVHTVTVTTNINFGGDGPKMNGANLHDDAFVWGDTTTQPALRTSDDNQPVQWVAVGDTLIGYKGNGRDEADKVIEIKATIDLTATPNTSFEVILHQAVEHHVPDGGDLADYNTDLVDDVDKDNKPTDGQDSTDDTPTDLNFSFTITDNDGDNAKGTVTVQIEDDIIVLHDTDTTTTVGSYVPATESAAGYYLVDTDNNNVNHGKVSGVVEYTGADGLESMVIAPPANIGTVPFYQTVTVEGEPKEITIVINPDDGKLYGIEGRYESGKVFDFTDPYFTFTLNSTTGKWEFEQLKDFGGDIKVTVKGTDNDGDSNTHEIVIKTDDKPFINTTPKVGSDEVYVSEVFLGDGSGKDPDLTDAYKDDIASNTIKMGVGADGYFGGSFDTAFSWDIPTEKLTSNGKEVKWDDTGNPLEGYIENADGSRTTVLTVTMGTPDVNGNATYTVDLKEAVKHANADGNNEITDIEFGFSLKDVDGDEAKGSITANIEDDVPLEQKDVEILNVTGDETSGYTASTLVELEFGADDGSGKEITIDGITYEYTDGMGWTSDGGTTYVDANDGLTFGNITLSKNSGENDFWTATMTGGKGDATWSQSSNITITDADGDSTSFNVSANSENASPSGEIIGLAGSSTSLLPGGDYNIAIILDTSGSMYDDDNRDIKDGADGDPSTVESRLGQACDAISKFIIETLHAHANDGTMGGDVNLLITTFWGRTENGDNDIYNSTDKQSSGATYIETLKPEDFAGMTEDEIYSAIAEILAMNAVGVTYDSTTNTFNYDPDAHKALTEALKDPTKDADDAYNPLSGSETGFHWGTEYHQGFETAAAWFAQFTDPTSPYYNDYINEAFLITDGAPYDSETERIVAYNKMLVAMGIVKEGANANEYYTIADDGTRVDFMLTTGGVYSVLSADGSYTQKTQTQYYEDLPKSNEGNKVHAVGMGDGADLDTLDKYDTTPSKDDPTTSVDESLNNSTLVEDGNINDLFSPGKGTSATLDNTHIGFTQDGNDVLLGDINLKTLREYFGFSDSSGDKVIIDFLRNNPEWMLDSKNLNDIGYAIATADALVGGEKDDLIYGQGGDDILLGDGDTDALKTLADKLGINTKVAVGADGDINNDGVINKDDFSESNIIDKNTTSLDTAALVKALNDAVRDDQGNIEAGALEKLANAAAALESKNDGNDTIYGGDDDDIIFGFGGDDTLYGGEGSDIMFGGSGSDLIFVDEMYDNASERDYVDGGTDQFLDSSIDIAVINDVYSGINAKINNVELMVKGDVNGTTTDEVLKELGLVEDGGYIKFEENTLSSWNKLDTNNPDFPDGYIGYEKNGVEIYIDEKRVYGDNVIEYDGTPALKSEYNQELILDAFEDKLTKSDGSNVDLTSMETLSELGMEYDGNNITPMIGGQNWSLDNGVYTNTNLGYSISKDDFDKINQEVQNEIEIASKG